jgi:hypothetical protein
MFHLSDPTHGIRAIKFSHLKFGKTQFTINMVGMKGHGMGGFNTLWV